MNNKYLTVRNKDVKRNFPNDPLEVSPSVPQNFPKDTNCGERSSYISVDKDLLPINLCAECSTLLNFNNPVKSQSTPRC